MQFTGLKDKNGKEIYESDIVRTYGGTIFRYVEYRKNLFALISASSGVEIEFPDREGSIEVIGNIYENPELIGDKND